MNPRAPLLIFDCDGVLVDSELIEHAVDAEVLAPFGCTASAEVLLQRFVGIARADMYRMVFADLGLEMPAGLLEDREARVWQRCQSDLRPVPGVGAALGALGHAKCVASSSLPRKLAMKLEVVGIVHHFAPHIFSTAEVSRGKPAPDIYLYAAGKVGYRASDCIVIEDSPHGIAGARAAGMRVLGFVGGGHASRRLLAELKDAGANGVVDHMDALPEAIARLTEIVGRA